MTIDNDNVKLVINSLNWVRKNSGFKIGILSEKAVENVLVEHGFDIQVLSAVSFNNLTLLEQFDALVLSSNKPEFMNVRTYVRNGGGLLIAATGWIEILILHFSIVVRTDLHRIIGTAK